MTFSNVNVDHDHDRMNPIAKQQWLKLLRSGKYKQGVGRLKRQYLSDTTAEYCCLGVLCKTKAVHANESFISLEVSLSKEQVDAAGLPQNFGPGGSGIGITYTDTDGNFDYCSFERLNDKYNLTFNQIADLIEFFL